MGRSPESQEEGRRRRELSRGTKVHAPGKLPGLTTRLWECQSRGPGCPRSRARPGPGHWVLRLPARISHGIVIRHSPSECPDSGEKGAMCLPNSWEHPSGRPAQSRGSSPAPSGSHGGAQEVRALQDLPVRRTEGHVRPTHATPVRPSTAFPAVFKMVTHRPATRLSG